MLDLAERLQDPELLGYAHFEMGCELLWSAELTAARQHHRQLPAFGRGCGHLRCSDGTRHFRLGGGISG
jgi:hypothetical protein